MVDASNCSSQTTPATPPAPQPTPSSSSTSKRGAAARSGVAFGKLRHAALLAAGGFTVGVLTQELNAPAWITLPAAVAIGTSLGFIVGLPSLRLRGIYLALSTLALHFAVLYLASEYQTHRRLSTGIVLPDPALGPPGAPRRKGVVCPADRRPRPGNRAVPQPARHTYRSRGSCASATSPPAASASTLPATNCWRLSSAPR